VNTNTIYRVTEVTVSFTIGKPHDVLTSCVGSCIMKYYRKKNHGYNLTHIGIVNIPRCNLCIECCKNMKRCKGVMTFLKYLEVTTVLVSFEKLQSRFRETAKFVITLQYTCFVLKEKGIFSLFQDI